MTVTEVVADLPDSDSVTWIYTVPAASPVTTPVVLTVATEVLSDDQVTVEAAVRVRSCDRRAPATSTHSVKLGEQEMRNTKVDHQPRGIHKCRDEWCGDKGGVYFELIGHQGNHRANRVGPGADRQNRQRHDQ